MKKEHFFHRFSIVKSQSNDNETPRKNYARANTHSSRQSCTWQIETITHPSAPSPAALPPPSPPRDSLPPSPPSRGERDRSRRADALPSSRSRPSAFSSAGFPSASASASVVAGLPSSAAGAFSVEFSSTAGGGASVPASGRTVSADGSGPAAAGLFSTRNSMRDNKRVLYDTPKNWHYGFCAGTGLMQQLEDRHRRSRPHREQRQRRHLPLPMHLRCRSQPHRQRLRWMRWVARHFRLRGSP